MYSKGVKSSKKLIRKKEEGRFYGLIYYLLLLISYHKEYNLYKYATMPCSTMTW